MYNETEIKETKKESSKRSFFHRRIGRLFTNIEQSFQTFITSMSLLSLMEVLLGIIFVIWTSIAIKWLGIFLGILLILYGALQIYFFFKRDSFFLFRYSIMYGVIGIIIGLCFFFVPASSFYFLTIFFGIFLLTSSIEKGIFSFHLFRIHEASALYLLVSALLGGFMAILLFINPFSHLLLAEVLGAFLMLKGILSFADMMLLKKRARTFLSFFE